MPYVPTNDRPAIDEAVVRLANEISRCVSGASSLIKTYKTVFAEMNKSFAREYGKTVGISFRQGELYAAAVDLADAVIKAGAVHQYEGAFLGELNYAVTRLIQVVPQTLVRHSIWKQEIRYWVYAGTAQALLSAAVTNAHNDEGIGGVFQDILAEYKRRVNTAYETEQILKSGDCYDTPYYTRLVAVVSSAGEHVGHLEVMLNRSEQTIGVDVLPEKVVLQIVAAPEPPATKT